MIKERLPGACAEVRTVGRSHRGLIRAGYAARNHIDRDQIAIFTASAPRPRSWI